MLSNRYIQRRVADTDARPCFVCYRPTTSVLVSETPGADFFFACDTHLKDPGFATIDSESQLAIKQREDKLKEIEALKAEWEELQKKKKKSASSSSEKDEKKDAADTTATSPPPELSAQDSRPIKPVYVLNKGVFNLRMNSKRQAAKERKTQAMLQNPSLFPQVPSHRPAAAKPR